MKKAMYMCITCGYLYNEVKMRQCWSELPDNWVCPECQSGKENYAELVIEPPSYKYPSEFNV